jgi:ParB family chromosome partitioning protein
MEIALLENLQREDLSSIEEANAYKKLQETLSLTQEELAKRLGKSRSHITNMLGLLSLPESIQKDISEKKISMGHARILSKLEDKSQQKQLEEKIIKEGISVRELEQLSKEPQLKKSKPQKRKETLVEYAYIEEELSEKLGTKVVVKKNKIEINYSNVKDLNRILDILNIEVDK